VIISTRSVVPLLGCDNHRKPLALQGAPTRGGPWVGRTETAGGRVSSTPRPFVRAQNEGPTSSGVEPLPTPGTAQEAFLAKPRGCLDGALPPWPFPVTGRTPTGSSDRTFPFRPRSPKTAYYARATSRWKKEKKIVAHACGEQAPKPNQGEMHMERDDSRERGREPHASGARFLGRPETVGPFRALSRGQLRFPGFEQLVQRGQALRFGHRLTVPGKITDRTAVG